MPVRVPLEFANPSMRLARPVCDAEGRLVAGAGTGLTARVVRLLRTMAVQSVLVADAEGVDQWQTVRPLPDEIAALDARFAATPASPALTLLHEAIRRRLAVRAARFDGDRRDD
jgi:hypothetical protein